MAFDTILHHGHDIFFRPDVHTRVPYRHTGPSRQVLGVECGLEHELGDFGYGPS